MNSQRLTDRINLMGPALKKRFGRPVRKIVLDAGASCPVRDANGLGGCSFCPPSGSGGGQGNVPLAQQIQAGLARLAARRKGPQPAALAYYQAYTTTHTDPATLAAWLSPALDSPGIDGLIVATRPDCLDGPRWHVLQNAAQQKPLWLELGLQSAHDQTLRAMGRGHDVACFDHAAAQAKQRGLEVVAHVILGLPGEDEGMCLATADHLAALNVSGVKLHNLMVLQGSALEAQWQAGEFEPWPLERWAHCTARFLARLPRATLVHRLAADAGRDTLLAPPWAADKDGALLALARAMEELNLEQGSHYRNP